MKKQSWNSLEEEARHLVALNQSEVKSIIRSYVFSDPNNLEIRVVHVDAKAFPEEEVMPILFGPDPQYNLHHRMLIAIIDVNASNHISPPDGWGNWNEAVIIERPVRHKAS